MSAESLCAYFQDHGLENTDFWLAEFSKLGVNSTITLKNLENAQEILSQLAKKANSEGEKIALDKILKADEFGQNESNQEIMDNKNKEQNSDIDDWRQKAESLLQKLEEFRYEEVSGHQTEIKEIEGELDNLPIPPQSLISEDKTIGELVKRITAHIDAKIMRNNKNILQTCSDGRALHGIFISKDLDSLLGDKQCLIKVPNTFRWTEEEMDDSLMRQFSSISDANHFIKVIEFLGHDIAASDSFPIFGSIKIANARAEGIIQQVSSITIKSFFTRLASISFDRSTLKLSEKACSELKGLLSIVQTQGELSSRAQEKCKEFFMLFGSHVSLGPLIYGGYFFWTCSSEGFQESQRETIKNMQENVVSTIPSDSFADFELFDDIKVAYKGTEIKNIVASTQLQLKICGSFPESTSFDEWKSDLLSNQNALVLIDRGRRLMAVWDIIKRNYDTEFGALINFLQNVWESITGLKAEKDILELSEKSECVLNHIGSWNLEEETAPEEIVGKLKHLLTVKREICGQEWSQHCWVREYLTDTKLLYFLSSIMNLEADSSTLEEIKYIMIELLSQDDLRQLNNPDFRYTSKLSNWLYPENQKHADESINNIVDFSTFIDFLKNKIVAATMPNFQFSQKGLTRAIEMGIQRLRLCYYQKYEDILITILAFPFQSSNTDDVIRLKPVSQEDLVELQQNFSKEAEVFERYKNNRLHLQVYLLLLVIMQHQMDYFKELMKYIISKMKGLQPPIEQNLVLEIKKHLLHPSLISKCKPMLESLLTSSQDSFMKPSSSSHGQNSLSLKSLLQEIAANQQHLSTFEAAFPAWDKNPRAQSLFDKVGLSEYFPKKLGLKDALCIKKEVLKMSLSGTSPTEIKKLPPLVLHKIMSYDSASLSDLMSKIQEVTENEEEEDNDSDDDSDQNDSSNDEDDDGDIFFDASSSFIDDEDIHPIDALLVLIHCSDDFLRQDLFSRLAKCQRAIPFLIPNPFTRELTLPLWAMSSIIQEWKSMGKEKNIEEQTHHIVNYPMPIVSFIRFGTNHDRVSKSKILNDVISESESTHNFFFHRDCPGGQYRRVIGEGLVDMSWYLPSGKETDLFSDAITFLNLHGDARQYQEQTSFLSHISSMCFVLITEKDLEYDSEDLSCLERFSLSHGGIAILNTIIQKSKSLKKVFPKALVIDQTKINSAFEIKNTVRQKIKQKLRNFVAVQSIEACVRETGFVCIDEESDYYKEGKIHAGKLMDLVVCHSNKKIGVKEEMLPLQGETLWRSWAFHDKELHRQIERGKETVNEYSSNMEEVKDSIRSDQMKYIDSLTPMTELFIKSLLTLGQSPDKSLRNYFLQCFKLDLNTLSRETMSKMQHKYQSLRKDLSLVQSNSQHPEEVEKKKETLKKELEVLQEEIINSSFGLEHFFRELGQVYEAALKSRKIGDNLSCLPKAVAELLIDGYPLELMDGDAAHVPLDWVTAVLDEAVHILKDPKVFVLSVLGLQSTGKSTMLNTTFGVQFNVSAGRCTRGAYMQLLPLDEEIKKETNCSYVLIVDTEGLRAPELDPNKTQKHDNELATFVIGLANTTLINIYGEVPGDMDDILQTSVHALLRMTKVKYHPSCQFVHQNAGGNVKSEVGRAKFTQKLNKFTVDAAREEHCEGQYKCFNDVIEFDDQTDVHYFPGLWKGDPPMAPVNQGYSRAAQQLKQNFIQRICNRASSSDLSLSSFTVRVSDLWNALLREKFVFSFKNTLEITAYHSLETAYSKWQWRLRNAMLNWEQKAENVITTEPSETASKIVTQKLSTLPVFISKEYNPIKLEMDKFFNGKQSEILIQWKAKFEIRLNSLLEQLKQHAEEHCNRLLNRRQAISAFEKSRKRDAEEIKRKVQEHIENVKREQEELLISFKNGKLESQQLKKLLERDLFTYEKLGVYEEKKIITPEQVKSIISIARESGSKLTENSLKKILSGGTLSTSQVQSILKKMHQTEKELKIEFEKIWIEWTSQLRTLSRVSVDVEKEVEYIITEFVKAKGYEGQLIEKIKKANLKKWGTRMNFTPKKDIHFIKAGWKIRRFIKGMSNKIFSTPESEACPDIILKITQDILHDMKQYLNETTKKETDFQIAYVHQLLNLVEKQINDSSRTIKDTFTFTYEYRIDMYLIASGYAIPKFDVMAKLFQEKNDPLLYLERKEKSPLFIKFKSQYAQTEAEEAIADTLCAYLENPIKMQIRKKLGQMMVTKMKSSGQHFSSKMALKVKVLCDLHNKDFKSHMSYVHDVRKYLEDCLKYYTMTYCDEKIANTSTTRLQQTAREEVSRLIQFVETFVTDTHESYAYAWLDSIFRNENFRSELGEKLDPDDILRGYNSKQQLDLKGFKKKVTDRLQELRKGLHQFYDSIECKTEMVYWKEKPHELLQDLMGCTAQCPFCREQCELLDPNHTEKHWVSMHRITCVNGRYHRKTRQLLNGLCPSRVASEWVFYKADDKPHPYKKYEEVYPDWSIVPDVSSQSCLYWKMFVANNADALANHYKKEKPPVEDHWRKIKWDEVEENLKKVYKA